MIDGIVFADCCRLATLVITTDGAKVPVGLWGGTFENGTLVKDLLADPLERGLCYGNGIVVVVDGPKALAAGVKRMIGHRDVVHRFTLHEHRDAGDYLGPVLNRAIDRQVARAFNGADGRWGLPVAKGIAAPPDAKRPSAAAGRRQRLEDESNVSVPPKAYDRVA